MPYLIDGHNLIPKIPGLNLQAADDEIRLVELLQEFCRVQRKAVDVYFDNAPPGHAGSQRFGQVTAHFIRRGSSADHAIRIRLSRLGKNASSWIVVSSDGEVQSAARLARAQIISAESFALTMKQTLNKTTVREERSEDRVLGAEELAEWLKLFGQ